MKMHQLVCARSVLLPYLLLGTGLAACAAEALDPEEEAEPSSELGLREQAFSNPAAAVTSAENLDVPFASTVKIKIDGENCSAIKIARRSGSNRDRFLTAAHCLTESSAQRSVTITNALNGGGASTFTIPGGGAFVHPSFQLGNVGGGLVSSNVYDFAFFEVAEATPFPFTSTAFTDIAENGVNMTAVGYGNAGVGCGAVGGTKLKVPRTSISVVGSDRRVHGIHHSGEPRNCSGDSGGPLLLGTGVNARVVGVVSAVSVEGNPPLSTYGRLANVLEWVNDPVDSTLASVPSSLIANNSALYLMNGTLAGALPRLGCVAMEGTAPTSPTAVLSRPCDGSGAPILGKPPAWRLLTSAGGFKIVNRRNGLCLGVSVAPAAGVTVSALTCATAAPAINRQSWTFEAVAGSQAGTTAYRLKTVESSAFCLSSAGADGSSVTLASCSTSNSQKWYATR